MAVSVQDLKVTIVEKKSIGNFKDDMCKLIATLIHNEMFEKGDEGN